MVLSKPRMCLVSTLAVFCGIVFCNGNSPVKADAVKTQQGVVMKSTSLVTTNVIKVPDKSAAYVQSASSSKGNRGDSVEFNGVKGANNNISSFAYKQIGKPYVWGASGPDSFDCSGLAMYVYSQFGIYLPHYTGSQFAMGQPVSKSELAPGDLVFFNTYSSVSHVGIYIGGGNFIHAPGTGSRVTVSSLGEGYYQSAYAGARRYIK